jgi:hypothetical protein
VASVVPEKWISFSPIRDPRSCKDRARGRCDGRMVGPHDQSACTIEILRMCHDKNS